MKKCPKCGAEVSDSAKFCNSCGETISGEVSKPAANTNILSRNIVTCVILTIVTCGIYGIYWLVVLNDDVKNVSQDNEGPSGAMLVILCLVTCGIYQIYWYYQTGKKMQKAGQNYGVDIPDNSVIYLVLGLFGFGIVNYCLMQNDLNRLAN